MISCALEVGVVIFENEAPISIDVELHSLALDLFIFIFTKGHMDICVMWNFVTETILGCLWEFTLK